MSGSKDIPVVNRGVPATEGFIGGERLFGARFSAFLNLPYSADLRLSACQIKGAPQQSGPHNYGGSILFYVMGIDTGHHEKV